MPLFMSVILNSRDNKINVLHLLMTERMHIFVFFDENDREYKGNLKRTLKVFFVCHCFFKVIYRVIPFE